MFPRCYVCLNRKRIIFSELGKKKEFQREINNFLDKKFEKVRENFFFSQNVEISTRSCMMSKIYFFLKDLIKIKCFPLYTLYVYTLYISCISKMCVQTNCNCMKSLFLLCKVNKEIDRGVQSYRLLGFQDASRPFLFKLLLSSIVQQFLFDETKIIFLWIYNFFPQIFKILQKTKNVGNNFLQF